MTDFMAYLRERQAEEGQIVLGSNVESLLLDFETFDKLVETNLVLFDTVFNKRLVIPDFQVSTPTKSPSSGEFSTKGQGRVRTRSVKVQKAQLSFFLVGWQLFLAFYLAV